MATAEPANARQVSLRVLEHTGLRVKNPEALARYRQGGEQVEGNRVHASMAMIAEALRERRFIFCVTLWAVTSLQLNSSMTGILLE